MDAMMLVVRDVLKALKSSRAFKRAARRPLGLGRSF